MCGATWSHRLDLTTCNRSVHLRAARQRWDLNKAQRFAHSTHSRSRFSACSVTSPSVDIALPLGQHKSHQPVLLVEEALAQKKENILDKTTKLQQHFLPRLQSCTLNTNAVKTQLGTETDRVRDQIETARQQAIDTIEAYAAQLLQNVDDIEMQRTKLLDSQLSELESLTEGMATAVRFSKELGSSSTSPEEMIALLTALDSRVSAFARSEQKLQRPACHASSCGF